MGGRGSLVAGSLALGLVLGMVAAPKGGHSAHAAGATLRVSGNHLVDASGATVVLHGANRSGSEYVCVHSQAFSDGPTDRASVDAMRTWGLDAVRVPLNEDCWLGINGVALGGAAYQRAVRGYVATIEAEGMYAILDLHDSAPGAALATGLEPMPDADHAPASWQGVAAAFGKDGMVIFDLFNEPYPRRDGDEAAMWACWRDGCRETSEEGAAYQAVGMAALVRVVRAAGATNVIMLGGVRHAGDVSRWATYVPADPLREVAAAQHFYYHGVCGSDHCRQTTTAVLAAGVPLIAGEVGDTDCSINNTGRLLGFLAAHGISYLGWVWGTNFGCQSLITSYAGTPSQPYGQWFHDSVLRAEGRPVVPGPLAAFFDNTGVVADGDQWSCGFDEVGACYSAQALAAAGLAPGRVVRYDGASLVWGAVPGQPDDVKVAGQTVAIAPTLEGAAALVVLGAATHGVTRGVVTLAYTDGTVATATLGLSDWTLSGGVDGVEHGNTIVARTAYVDRRDGSRQPVAAYLFATAIPLDRGKTLASVQLPVLPPVDVSSQQHVFAIGVAPP